MGVIRRTLANNITTSGVITSSAINNTSLNNVTSIPASIETGDLVLLNTADFAGESSASWTSQFDSSTYKEYWWIFNNVRPSVDNGDFTFNFSTDGGSSYNVSKAQTSQYQLNNEADDSNSLSYNTSADSALDVNDIILMDNVGNDADQGFSGIFKLMNPAASVNKQFFVDLTKNSGDDYSVYWFYSGVAYTTSEINGFIVSGYGNNISDGTIKMYGIK